MFAGQHSSPVIRSTSELSANAAVKIVVYGQSGVGKTVMARTAPNPLILSAERGLLSVRKFNLPFVEINTLDDLRNVYQWAATNPDARSYHTLYLDSITEIADKCLADEKAKNKDPRKAYGEMQDEIVEYFRLFRDLNSHHVVFVAQMEQQKDGVSGALLYGPSIPGQKLPQKVPYFFDETFHAFRYTDPSTQVVGYYLRTQPDNQYQAKDRSGNLDAFEPADIGHIIRKIQGA